jgi:RNAse (barnase) inhibitor barstar
MQTTVVIVPVDRIADWDSFHSVFKETLGFSDFYGRNMDA